MIGEALVIAVAPGTSGYRLSDDLVRYERALREQGFSRVAGADEAGRGALAGPLVAAAVVLPDGFSTPTGSTTRRFCRGTSASPRTLKSSRSRYTPSRRRNRA